MKNQDDIIQEYEILNSEADEDIQCPEHDFNNNISEEDSIDFIEILHPEDVRWFYRSAEYSRNNVLRVFSGYDSLRLETKFQELASFKGAWSAESDTEKIVVMKNLFEVDVRRRTCRPIYWTDQDDEFRVFRGTWFLSENNMPLMETLSDSIESQHMMNFGSLPYSFFKTSIKRSKKALHTTVYGDHVIIWYSPTDVYMYDNRSEIMKKLNISSLGRKIFRGYKQKAQFDKRPPEITHLCFVVHGIGQKLTGKINKQCHKLKHNCKRIIKTHFSVEQVGNFRIEFLPIEWRSGLNLDGGIIDSITPQEFKGLRTIFNSTIMDILYYSSSLYKPEITHGLESELNRIYGMFCERNPYFEIKGGKISILAHSLGSVICYDIIKSWISPLPDLEFSFLMNDSLVHSEDLRLKMERLKMAKIRIYELEEEIRRTIALQNDKMISNDIRNTDSPSKSKEGLIRKRITEIDNFFIMGSPLPVFLALRGLKPKCINDRTDILPTRVCKRIFNIFHPSDPIAYRLEPLVMKKYIKIKPVHILGLLKSRTNIDIGDDLNLASAEISNISCCDSDESEIISQSTFSDLKFDKIHVETSEYMRGTSTNLTNHISETLRRISIRKESIIPAVDELQMKLKNLRSFSFFKRITMFMHILKGEDISGYDKTCDDISTFSNENVYETLENRLDFTLGDEGTLLSFISLLTSHTSYWDDKTLARFLLNQVLEHKPSD